MSQKRPALPLAAALPIPHVPIVGAIEADGAVRFFNRDMPKILRREAEGRAKGARTEPV